MPITLDILDAISEGDLLVPTVLKLLKHPNPKIRSKAALFVGSRTQNVAWAASRGQEYDPRVRANILESLFGLDSEVVHQIFRNHVADENNRAAGNAVLGLYQLGDSESIPLIYEMGKHVEARFRNTCAWLMGKTGDPRFVPAVAELMQDPDEVVRSQAFKAMADLRRQMRSNTRPQLVACVLRVAGNADRFTMMAGVHDSAGLPVRRLTPMSFILRGKPATNVLRRFAVTEYDCRSSLNVGFVMCLPTEGEQSLDALINEAVLGCHPLRRSKDRWVIVKLSGRLSTQRNTEEETAGRQRQRYTLLNVNAADTDVLPSGEPRLEYTLHQPRIISMLGEQALVLDRSGEDHKTRAVANVLTRVDIACGKPHLVFVGIGPVPPILYGLDKAAVLHVIAVGEDWKTAEIQNLAQCSGGYYQNIGGLDEVGAACYRIHLALLHHYKISWNDVFQPAELEISSAVGRAVASYEVAAVVELPQEIAV